MEDSTARWSSSAELRNPPSDSDPVRADGPHVGTGGTVGLSRYVLCVQEDQVVLQCTATILKEQIKLCLSCEGFGNRLCFLETTSNAQNVPPDLAICCFILEQSLSVRALQEMLSHTSESSQGGGHRTLLYGHAILLRHTHSGMYLSCLTTSRSLTDKLAFDVGLQEDSTGEACWWTIHPASKQRSEGEKVRVGDDLILVSVSSERYLVSTGAVMCPPMGFAGEYPAAGATRAELSSGSSDRPHIPQCHLSYASGDLMVDASFMQTLWNMNPVCSGCELAEGPPQDPHRAGRMWVMDHSQHCSDTDVVVVVLVWVVLVWTVRDDSSSAAAQCSVGPLVLHQWTQDAAPQDTAHRTLPTGRCPQDAAPQDAAPQDAAPQDAAHRTLLHRTLPTGRCPQDAAHRTLPTGRCPQDAAPQDAAPQDAAPQDAAPQDAAHRTLPTVRWRVHLPTGRFSVQDSGTEVFQQHWLWYLTGGYVLRLFHGHMDECLAIPAAEQGDDQRKNAHYEGGAVCSHARSLWRLEPLRIGWSGSHIKWGQAFRVRHITTGRYLNLDDEKGLVLVDPEKANTKSSAFCFRASKEKTEVAHKRDVEGMGTPEIKYGESMCFVQHVATSLWLTYASVDAKSARLGPLKRKAILHQEGHMDDALTVARSQTEESQAARMIFSTAGLFTQFIKGLDSLSGKNKAPGPPQSLPLDAVVLSLQDLIFYFRPPEEELEHEEKQSKLRSLKNRQNLFQEEGMISLVLDCIDRLNVYNTAAHFSEFAGEEAAESWKEIVNLLYELLASLIRGNRANCALFCDNLDWLVSKLDRLEASSDQCVPVSLACPPAVSGHPCVPVSLACPPAVSGHPCLPVSLACPPVMSGHPCVPVSLACPPALSGHLCLPVSLACLRSVCARVSGMSTSDEWAPVCARVSGMSTSDEWAPVCARVSGMSTSDEWAPVCARVSGMSASGEWAPVSARVSGMSASSILEVLYCILIESPEVLNIIQENHIKSIIALLDKHGRNHKVLDVLCSLCVCNGVAVRSNQNLITENLLPGRDLLLQTNIINYVTRFVELPVLDQGIWTSITEAEVTSITEAEVTHPAVFVLRRQYKKWYYELIVDHVEPFLTAQAGHLRVGWALTEGYSPYPGGGEGWGSNGVGDDLYSYGFDGLNLWSGRVPRRVASPCQHILAADDVVSCCLDLSVPSISFRINGHPVQGMFENFNLDGLFFPVVSFSAGIKVRFLLGGRHGDFKFVPPPGYAPCYEAVLPKDRLRIEPIKEYKHDFDGVRNLLGPTQSLSHTAFTPNPVDTVQIVLPPHLERIREKLAENSHELWGVTRIEQGWTYGLFRDDNKKLHPCLVDFQSLPEPEKNYNLAMSGETLKTLLALGCHVGMGDEKAEENLKRTKLPKTYMQTNGYKPAPLDLNHVKLTPNQNTLVERLAENGHNVWARDRVRQGWTYSIVQDIVNKRNPRLVPYNLLDEKTKKTNRDTVCAAVRTLIGYGYNIEPPDQESSGHGVGENSGHKIRVFRAEKSYAVTQGKWYFEFEAVTVGEMRVGWARPSVHADRELGSDELAYVFNGFKAQRWHVGSEPFGRQWQPGDVVGCMIDLTEQNIMFTLNGEMLISDSGSEMAFKDIDIGEGFIPVCSLGLSQVGRINLGQNVSSLKYFTICGLQEGFEPFAINMKRDITMWFSKSLPQFVPAPPDHPHIEVSRVDGTVDSAPCLKLTHKTYGSQNANTDLLFLRLSMPIEFHETFKVPAGRTPLTRALTIPEDEALEVDPNSDYELLKKSATRKEQEEKEKEPSVPKELPGIKEGENDKDTATEKSKKKGFFSKAKKAAFIAPPPVVPTVPRLVEDVVPDDRDDVDIISNTTTYYYSVRVFAGQEPSGVWVGWVTPDYHQYDPHFDLSKVRNVTVTVGDDKGNIHDSMKRSNCYMVWGGEFSSSQQTRISQEDFVIGCLVDLDTGLMTFTANGKEVNTFYQVEPTTKLFPAVFCSPSSQNMLQVELGKLKNIMPISAAMFRSDRKNPVPQCPPRLDVQMLTPVIWQPWQHAQCVCTILSPGDG
ncbi:hypothetical protein NFI96_026241 [Prochilodus magdalenae]|nr:hypothetical protein NFI96_026241 [Prochilodus magdalenae]